MTFEVEMKFPIGDVAAFVERLEGAGGKRGQSVQQTDMYFNHPSRDFGRTDEAFRVRSTDGRHRVTYKGPLVDAETKTRREIEIPIGESDEDAGRLQEMLACLGFREVRTVRKTRDDFALSFEGRPFEVCVDRVEGLGDFVELETQADDAGLAAARESVQRLAKHLGLANSERRSYLCLLMESEVGPRRPDRTPDGQTV
jgi:adenylate cyclase, class 2